MLSLYRILRVHGRGWAFVLLGIHILTVFFFFFLIKPLIKAKHCGPWTQVTHMVGFVFHFWNCPGLWSTLSFSLTSRICEQACSDWLVAMLSLKMKSWHPGYLPVACLSSPCPSPVSHLPCGPWKFAKIVQCEEASVSEMKPRQEGLMMCLMSLMPRTGCWLWTVEVRGTILHQDSERKMCSELHQIDCF